VLQVLLDIGAGIGLYSLAAAAAGRSVVAFEQGPKNLASLRASIAYNDFPAFVTVSTTFLPF